MRERQRERERERERARASERARERERYTLAHSPGERKVHSGEGGILPERGLSDLQTRAMGVGLRARAPMGAHTPSSSKQARKQARERERGALKCCTVALRVCDPLWSGGRCGG